MAGGEGAGEGGVLDTLQPVVKADVGHFVAQSVIRDVIYHDALHGHSPFDAERCVGVAFLAQECRHMAGLLLDDMAQEHFLAPVAFGFFQAVEDPFGDGAAGFGGEPQVLVLFEVRAAVGHGEDDAVGGGGAEFFDEVEHQAGFAGAVGVEEAGVGVEAGEDDGAFDLGVEDAVGVVEGGVEGVLGPASDASIPVWGYVDDLADGVPVFFGGAAFDGEDLEADGFDVGAVQAFEFDEVVEDFAGAPLEFAEGVLVGLFAVFGHVAEECGLVEDFAGGEGFGEADAALVGEGFDLGAAGLDGADEAGGVDAGADVAGGADEVDGDAGFAAGGDGVGGDGDAAAGDEYGVECEEGSLLEEGIFEAHLDALGVFADEGSPLVDDQVCEVHAGSSSPRLLSLSVEMMNQPPPLTAFFPIWTWEAHRSQGSRGAHSSQKYVADPMNPPRG